MLGATAASSYQLRPQRFWHAERPAGQVFRDMTLHIEEVVLRAVPFRAQVMSSLRFGQERKLILRKLEIVENQRYYT
jgi:hypothetical protein